jgi:hypothetical protein
MLICLLYFDDCLCYPNIQSAGDQAVLQNIISLVKEAESQEPVKQQQQLSNSKQQFSTAAASTDQDRLLRRPM